MQNRQTNFKKMVDYIEVKIPPKKKEKIEKK